MDTVKKHLDISTSLLEGLGMECVRSFLFCLPIKLCACDLNSRYIDIWTLMLLLNIL